MAHQSAAPTTSAASTTGGEVPTDPAAIASGAQQRAPAEVMRFAQSTVRFSTIGLFIIVLSAALYTARYVLAPVTAGVLVGFTFGPISGWLEQRGVRPALASASIVLSAAAVISVLLIGLAAPLEEWSSRVPELTEAIQSQWEKLKGPIETIKKVEEQVADAAKSEKSQPVEVTVKSTGIVTDLISSAPDAAARFLIFIGTFYFFLATRTSMKRVGLRFLPTRHLQFSVARILRDTESYLSRYVATITLINIGLGIAVGIAMYLLGLPQAHLWGALAMVLNYAAYIGPAAMTLILLGVGILTFPNSAMALAPPLAYIAINGLEGQFITPAILGGRLALNPLIVFISITFWLWLWGPVGAFLAVPILIIATMTLYHLVPNVSKQPRSRKA